MRNLYILGNGGFANYIYKQLVKKSFFTTEYYFRGFITLKGGKAFCVSETGITPFTFPKQASFILGTNKTKYRNEFFDILGTYYKTFDKELFPNIVLGVGFVDLDIELGYGNLICDYASIVGPGVIGNFNSINMYANIQHNCKIGNNNVISPYVCVLPKTKIADNNFIGTHATINRKLTLGSNITISAGEGVFEDIGDRVYFQSGFAQGKP